MKDIPSTARSPQQMFGPIAKTYLADKMGVKREDMIVVSIMPCLAKKYECQREKKIVIFSCLASMNKYTVKTKNTARICEAIFSVFAKKLW